MNDEERRAATVALLKQEGCSQTEIMKMMGISQSTVSRDLVKAKKLVKFVPDWIQGEPSDDDYAAMETLKYPGLVEFEEKLRKMAEDRGQVAPSSVRVLHASGTTSDFLEFGRQAANRTANLIRRSRNVAVAWGKTLDSLVAAMGQREGKASLRFIPVSGQPLNSYEPGSSPSSLAKSLSNIYGVSEKRRLSLHGVPARIPKAMHREAETILNFVRNCDHYRKIFGSGEDDESALMNKVDMILSGIGDAKSSRGDQWFLDIKRLEDEQALNKFARGNIGGIWLPKTYGNQKQHALVADVNSRSLGISLRQLKTCSENANSTTKPGVVVLAREPGKARTLLSTVGLVNHYIITKDLFDAANKLL